MNKKLMTVAVASAMAAGVFAAPEAAFAQASTVQMFGRLNFLYGSYDNGAGRIKNDAMADSESEIGVKGEENVGGGLIVHFQCLTSFDVVGIRSEAGTAGWCGRNSNVGLKGGFGNVFIGNWDTAPKIMMGNYRVFALNYPMGLGNTFNNSASNVGNPAPSANGVAATAATTDAASFSRRQSKSLHYWSPNFSGFQAMATMSATNESTLVNDTAAVQKPRMWAAALNYSNGPMGVGIGYERHQDYNPASLVYGVAAGQYSGGSDSSLQVGAGWNVIPNVRLNAMYVYNKYDPLPGQDMNQTNWNLNGQWDIAGPHLVRLGYVKLGSTKGNYGAGVAAGIAVGQARANGGVGNTGASKIVFEYGYNLSKRTELSLGYARTSNDAISNLSVGGNADANTAGQTQRYIGGRISHRF